MDANELQGCFKLLRAYWPGEWDEARYMVWADAFGAAPAERVRDALVELGKTAKFPTVAEFVELLRASAPRSTTFFAPGTGWMAEIPPRALPECDAEVVDISERLRELRESLKEAP